MVFLGAFLRLAPGLRDIVERDGHALGTRHPSTLSYALASLPGLRLVRALLERLAPARHGHGELIALDSMAVTVPRTRRHNCALLNNKTAGGGVLWAYALDACRSLSPVRVLAVMSTGSWCDCKVIADVKLQAGGPIYLMDRGFYTIDLVAQWIAAGVRFIVRARGGRDLRYEVVEDRGTQTYRSRRHCMQIVFDGVARLGSAARRGTHPVVRLVICKLPGGKQLVLVSGEIRASARRLLDNYYRRWEIERFHKLLKRTIGLAHLYSYRQRGIEFLIHVAVLLTVLLWIDPRHSAPSGPPTPTIVQMQQIIREARRPLNLHRLWRPNTIGKIAWRHRTRKC